MVTYWIILQVAIDFFKPWQDNVNLVKGDHDSYQSELMDYIWDPHFSDRSAVILTKKKVGWTPDASEATEYDNLDEFPPSMN